MNARETFQPGSDKCVWRLGRALRRSRLDPDSWGFNFVRSILRHSKRRNWEPSEKQVSAMRSLLSELAVGAESFIDEDGFGNRIAALEVGDGVPLWTLPTAIDLCKADADAKALMELIAHLARHHGGYALIVVDTLARAISAKVAAWAKKSARAGDTGAVVNSGTVLTEFTSWTYALRVIRARALGGVQ